MAEQMPYIDPTTGDFETINGSIVNRNLLQGLINGRLLTPRGSYLFDVNYGNPLQNSEDYQSDVGRQNLQREVKLALDDIVTLGYARAISVVVDPRTVTETSVSFDIFVYDDTGDAPQKFTWSLTT